MGHDRIRHNVGNEKTSSGATDADAEVAEGIVEVVHEVQGAGSMITQAIVEVSSTLDEVMVKEVPAIRADTRTHPGVPPSVLLVR